MMFGELFIRALAATRRSSLIWAGALLALVLSVLSVWPSLNESGGLDAIADGLSPELLAALGLEDFGSPVGYLNGNLYAMLLPLLLGALAIMLTNALTAGDEDAGRLELLLALPVSRAAVYLARILAVTVVLAAISLLLGVTLALSAPAFDMELDPGGIIGVTLAMFLLAVLHGAFAFALAGLGLRGGAVLGTSFALLVLGYLVHALMPLVADFADFADASPWEWALGNNPLADGLNGAGALALTGCAVALIVTGLVAVRLRSIRTA